MNHALLIPRRRSGFSPLSFGSDLALWLDPSYGVYTDDGLTLAVSDGDLAYRTNDQSPNLRFVSQATEAKRPALKLAQQNGKPSIRFDGVDNLMRSPEFALAQPLTVYLVANNTTSDVTGRFYDGNTVNEALLAANGSGVQPYELYAGSAYACHSEGSIDADIFAAVFNGASSLLECGNRAAVTGNPGTAGWSTGACLGSSGNETGGFFLAHDLFALVACSGAHTLAQRNQMRAYFRGRFGAIPQVRCDGDSLTFGTGSTAGNDYPSQLASLLGAGYSVVNDGATNETADTMATAAQLNHGRYCSALRTTYAVLWAGTNDIVYSATAAAVYADLKAWWATMRANGARVIATNIIKRGDFDAGMETIRQATNVLIDSDPSLYDARVNVADRAEFSDPNNATYFGVDTIHLTNAGYAIVAGLVQAAVVST